jgi:YVTN family beta-propeller protein
VLSAGTGTLTRIDPRTNAVAGGFPQPAGAGAIRAAFGALWVSVPGEGSLLRLDPATGRTVAKVPVGVQPRFLAVGEKSVWVLNQGDGSVTRVDPATNAVTATIRVDSVGIDGGDIAVGGGAVWARITEELVARIDPATNTVSARYGPRSGSGSVAADDAAVWISAHDVRSVWRLPLTR